MNRKNKSGKHNNSAVQNVPVEYSALKNAKLPSECAFSFQVYPYETLNEQLKNQFKEKQSSCLGFNENGCEKQSFINHKTLQRIFITFFFASEFSFSLKFCYMLHLFLLIFFLLKKIGLYFLKRKFQNKLKCVFESFKSLFLKKSIFVFKLKRIINQ